MQKSKNIDDLVKFINNRVIVELEDIESGVTATRLRNRLQVRFQFRLAPALDSFGKANDPEGARRLVVAVHRAVAGIPSKEQRIKYHTMIKGCYRATIQRYWLPPRKRRPLRGKFEEPISFSASDHL